MYCLKKKIVDAPHIPGSTRHGIDQADGDHFLIQGKDQDLERHHHGGDDQEEQEIFQSVIVHRQSIRHDITDKKCSHYGDCRQDQAVFVPHKVSLAVGVIAEQIFIVCQRHRAEVQIHTQASADQFRTGPERRDQSGEQRKYDDKGEHCKECRRNKRQDPSFCHHAHGFFCVYRGCLCHIIFPPS
jgi:hypothetical protein